MNLINAGYVAFNGHVFTEAEANSYNQACRDAERNPSDFNLDQRHRVFISIVTKGKGYDTETT